MNFWCFEKLNLFYNYLMVQLPIFPPKVKTIV